MQLGLYHFSVYRCGHALQHDATCLLGVIGRCMGRGRHG